jgi:hypothetical protein
MKAVVKARPEFGGSQFTMPAGLTEVVVDPETGMLADSFCPQSERVVLPRSAASNIKCILHQPQPDVLVAENFPSDSVEIVSDIPAAVHAEPEADVERNVRPYINYFEENQKPPRRSEPNPPVQDRGKPPDEDEQPDGTGRDLEGN